MVEIDTGATVPAAQHVEAVREVLNEPKELETWPEKREQRLVS